MTREEIAGEIREWVWRLPGLTTLELTSIREPPGLWREVTEEMVQDGRLVRTSAGQLFLPGD